MGMLVSPYRFSAAGGGGGASSNPVPIALARRNAATSFGIDGAITWDTEVYDSGSAFTATSANITVPSAGLYRMGAGVSCNINQSGYKGCKTNTSGNLYGAPAISFEDASPRQGSAIGGIVSLSSSDILLIKAYANNNYGGTTKDWMCVEQLDSATLYCLARKGAGNQTVTSGTITFDTEIADTGGWHSTSSNTDRMTVPSGITRARFTANLVCNNTPSTVMARLLKNGTSEVVGYPARRRNQNVHKLVNLSGPPVSVTAGDYVQVEVTYPSSSSVLQEEFTWFCAEEIPSTTKSALVYNAGSYNVGTSLAAVSWDSEDHDTDSIHSTGSNTSRMTAPSGVSYVRLFFYIKGASASTVRLQAEVYKNGSAVNGSCSDSEAGDAADYQRLSGASAWIQCTSGDYFELMAQSASGTIACTGGYFAAEFI